VSERWKEFDFDRTIPKPLISTIPSLLGENMKKGEYWDPKIETMPLKGSQER